MNTVGNSSTKRSMENFTKNIFKDLSMDSVFIYSWKGVTTLMREQGQSQGNIFYSWLPLFTAGHSQSNLYNPGGDNAS